MRWFGYDDPLYDPEEVDSLGEHLAVVVWGDPRIGDVCDAYDVCRHPFCAASYGAWVEMQKARDAITKLRRELEAGANE